MEKKEKNVGKKPNVDFNIILKIAPYKYHFRVVVIISGSKFKAVK